MSLLDLLLERSIGGGDDAHVDLDVGGAADTLERLLFEEAQQLGLQQRDDLANLVEEHRAAVGGFNQSAFLAIGAGERAAFVTEQSLSSGVSVTPNR